MYLLQIIFDIKVLLISLERFNYYLNPLIQNLTYKIYDDVDVP